MNPSIFKKKKTLLIVLIAFLILWGLFYFFGNSKKSLVSENMESSPIRNDSDNVVVEEQRKDVEESDIKKDEIIKFPEKITEIEKTDEEETGVIEKKEVVLRDEINDKLVSWGFAVSSNRNIDTIVIHSSYNALGGDEYDLDRLIQEYKEYGVAPHYLIDKKGSIYRLVEDKNIAYHAGESRVPDGRSGVNNFSIGIELMNTKTDKYEKEQYESVNWLIGKIKEDYDIKYILGHSEIAPGRKTDPWNIDWNRVDR